MILVSPREKADRHAPRSRCCPGRTGDETAPRRRGLAPGGLLRPAAAPPALTRELTAIEQKNVAALQARLNRHYGAGELEQAARLAEQIAVVRARLQGAGHWQAIDARFAAGSWQRLAKVPVADRPAVLR